MFWPCEARTPTCRNFATISSGLYRFLGLAAVRGAHLPDLVAKKSRFHGESADLGVQTFDLALAVAAVSPVPFSNGRAAWSPSCSFQAAGSDEPASAAAVACSRKRLQCDLRFQSRVDLPSRSFVIFRLLPICITREWRSSMRFALDSLATADHV